MVLGLWEPSEWPLKLNRVSGGWLLAIPPRSRNSHSAAGELLSPGSTQHLLDIMSHTKTGANRLKGGLAPGWVLNHKTGTGQVLGPNQAGYNDIGILTAPDGRSYSVAVMIRLTSVPLPVRMELMNNVVRAVIAQHDMQYVPAAQQ